MKYEVSDMVDVYYRARCPHCGALNWVQEGDINDLSQLDIDSIKCFSCDTIFLLTEPDEYGIIPENTVNGFEME